MAQLIHATFTLASRKTRVATCSAAISVTTGTPTSLYTATLTDSPSEAALLGAAAAAETKEP